MRDLGPKEHPRDDDPERLDDAGPPLKDVRARTRGSGLSREDQARVERETDIVPLQEAIESGAVLLERLPGGRAWILKEGITADLMRIISAPIAGDATQPELSDPHGQDFRF